MKILIPFFFILLLPSFISIRKLPPEVQILTSGNGRSLRGLSVVSNNVIWVSGDKGTVGRSLNAGKNWKWITVRGFEKMEFRDIEAFDGNMAIILSVGEPGYILKTVDGGETWKTVYENHEKGIFLDAMDFVNGHGLVIGDPIDNKVFIAETKDGGSSWNKWSSNTPLADSGEAFFAASGTNIRLFDKGKFFLVSGGTRSRLFTENGITQLPIIQGKETTGANSIAVYDEGKQKGSKKIIVAGGDFNADSSAYLNCFYSNDGGSSWKAPSTPPHGYRSCIEFLSKRDILSCGLTGVDYSSDGGKTFELISKESFHVCRIAKAGSAVFLAGNNGKVGRLVFKQ